MFINPGLGPTATPAPGLVPGMVQPPPPSLPPISGVPTPNDDGGIDFLEEPEDDGGKPDLTSVEHDANLAEAMDDDALNAIAEKLLEGIEADEESNREMYDIFREGLKFVVVKPGARLGLPFEGAAGCVHPLLLEAGVRFAANARGEMLPAAGPVRMQIIGDGGPQLEQIAQRKADWLNYYLTSKDEDYYPDFDQMLVMLGFYGSMFRKVYRDPQRRGMPVSRSLSPFDLLVSYSATSLHGSERVTHIEHHVSKADITRLQLKAWYRDIDLALPTDDEDAPEGERIVAEAEGRTPSDQPDDQTYKLYHCHCLLDIDGLEHRDDDDEPTGLPLPFIVTLEPESRKVLRIARNWSEDDPDYQPREYYVHFQYMPGFGFYGWGLIHLLGSTADALTMMRRQGINTITLKTFPGGVRVKGARDEKKDPVIGPGQFVEIDTGGLPISAALMPLPYADLPTSFVPVVEEILESGQRLGSIGDMAVGEGREDALPGTVIALIEQSVKLEASVLKRLHTAQRKELRLLADLFGADPEAKYPYIVGGKRGTALAQDFQDNEDIVPVSDPNIPTRTQRLAQAQAVVQMSQASNGLIDPREAYQEFLRTLGKTDQEIATLMPQPPQGQPADPVTEVSMWMAGMPLKADPAQDHKSHIDCHLAAINDPGVAQMLAKVPALMAKWQAHIGEHFGLYYAGAASQLTGTPMLPGQIPPQAQAQVASAVAAASGKLTTMMAQLAPQAQGDPLAAAKIQIDAQKVQLERQKMILDAHDQDRKAAQTELDQQMDWRKLQAQLADNAAQRQSEAAQNQNETIRGVLSLRTAQVDAGANVQQAAMERDSTIAEKLVEHATVAKRADADVQAEGLKTAATIGSSVADAERARHEAEGEKHAAEGEKAKARAAVRRPKTSSKK